MESFNEILKLASQKQGVAEKELVYKKGINTNLGKAKREQKDRPKGVQSAAVRAFLKKKEDEEKKKAKEDLKKKENLMKLREEKNTVGKMRKIIKRNHTKEAIFQVEGKEERDKEDTPTLTPNKLDEKITEYTKLKSQVGGKVRTAVVQHVKRVAVSANWVPKEEREAQESAALASSHSIEEKPSKTSSQNEDDKVPRKPRFRANRYDKEREMEEEKAKQEKEKELKKKKRPPAPPPMNFNDLLKLAEDKKNGVVQPVKKPENDKKPEKGKMKEPKLPDRPMTQDEKERWMRVHSKEYQAWIKLGKNRPDFCIKESKKKRRSQGSPGSGSLNIKSAATVAVSDSESDCDEVTNNSTKSVPSKANTPSASSKNGIKQDLQRQSNKSSNSNKPVSKSLNLKPSKELVSNSSAKSDSSKNSSSLKQGKSAQLSNRPQSSTKGNSSSQSVSSSSSKKPSSSSQMSSKGGNKVKNGHARYDQVNENVLVCGDSSSNGNKKKERPQKEEPQMSTWDRIYGDIQKKKKPKQEMKKRRVIESDSEVDSELDDFIVDEEDEDDMDDFIDDSGAMDYSKHIAAIFGYDKNKYRHVDEDDLDDMEAGFADVEREERISEQIGMKEDLEDMKMEELHKKRKMQMKKQMAKKMRR